MSDDFERAEDALHFPAEIVSGPGSNAQRDALVAGYGKDHRERLRLRGVAELRQAIQPLCARGSGHDDRSRRPGLAKQRCTRPHRLRQRPPVDRRHVDGHYRVSIPAEITTHVCTRRDSCGIEREPLPVKGRRSLSMH
jgi:hypothetical protein